MNRLTRPIQFAFEPDLVYAYARASFGAAGAPTLDTKNSKGFCQWALSTPVGTASITNTSTSVTAAKLYGVFNGMSVSGTGIQAGTTVSSVNPAAGTMTLSLAAQATNAAAVLTFSGGQYVVTLGAQLTPFKRLDAYVKLLGLKFCWDMQTNTKAVTGATPQSPAAPFVFLLQDQTNIGNQTFTATGTTSNASNSVTAVSNTANIVPGMGVSSASGDIPAGTTVIAVGASTITLSANATAANTNEVLTFVPLNPASVIIQCGSLSGATFTAANPGSGEALRMGLELSRSSAI